MTQLRWCGGRPRHHVTRLDTIASLAEGIREVRDLGGERGSSLTVQVESNHNKFLENGFTVAEHSDHLAALEEIGVNNFVIKIPSDNLESACDYLRFYGETFIRPNRRKPA